MKRRREREGNCRQGPFVGDKRAREEKNTKNGSGRRDASRNKHQHQIMTTCAARESTASKHNNKTNGKSTKSKTPHFFKPPATKHQGEVESNQQSKTSAALLSFFPWRH